MEHAFELIITVAIAVLVSNASSVTLFDQGNLLLGIRNSGASYIRVNIITLYGTAL